MQFCTELVHSMQDVHTKASKSKSDWERKRAKEWEIQGEMSLILRTHHNESDTMCVSTRGKLFTNYYSFYHINKKTNKQKTQNSLWKIFKKKANRKVKVQLIDFDNKVHNT